MHLGIATMNNLHQARTDDLARMVEARGYESLWMGEHAHMPILAKSAYPGGGEMPETYKHMADPFVSIAIAAAATKNLRFGLGVALILERELFTLAKEVATLDQLSNGRLTLGIGVGWNRPEFENVARMPWEKRFAGLKECALALRALWTQDEAQFDGRWYKFDKVWSYPKPLQRPHPPLVLGVGGSLGIAMAAEWGDGWFPVDRFQDVEAKLESFRGLVKKAGRDPAKVEIGIAQIGEPDADRLRRYRDLGVQRAVIGGALGFADLGEATRFADKYAPLCEELAA
jgi:probable F420-dependent oxidoreductase